MHISFLSTMHTYLYFIYASGQQEKVWRLYYSDVRRHSWTTVWPQLLNWVVTPNGAANYVRAVKSCQQSKSLHIQHHKLVRSHSHTGRCLPRPTRRGTAALTWYTAPSLCCARAVPARPSVPLACIRQGTLQCRCCHSHLSVLMWHNGLITENKNL